MNNLQLAGEALTVLEAGGSQPISSPNVLVHALHPNPYLSAYLIAERRPDDGWEHANQVRLLEKVDKAYNESELRELAFRLQVDYEDLGGTGKRDQVRELIVFMQRHGRLAELVALVQQMRPKVRWDDRPQKLGGLEIVAKLNIAVVVEIIRPSLLDVARYLDDQEVDANFLLLRNARPDNKLLPTDAGWGGYVTAFAKTMDNIKHTFSGAQLHFFLAAPVALAFGLGCIWGTVDEATVYHYEKGTYAPVISVARTLR